MPCGWEGNRKSSVALAMHHRLKWFIHLRADGLDSEMSTPPTLSCGVWPILLTFTSRVTDADKHTDNGTFDIRSIRPHPYDSRGGPNNRKCFHASPVALVSHYTAQNRRPGSPTAGWTDTSVLSRCARYLSCRSDTDRKLRLARTGCLEISCDARRMWRQ